MSSKQYLLKILMLLRIGGCWGFWWFKLKVEMLLCLLASWTEDAILIYWCVVVLKKLFVHWASQELSLLSRLFDLESSLQRYWITSLQLDGNKMQKSTKNSHNTVYTRYTSLQAPWQLGTRFVLRDILSASMRDVVWGFPQIQGSKTYEPDSKVLVLGMRDLPPLIGSLWKPYNGYINPYYWVDEFIPYYMEI